jgi:hypothetical protein
MLHSRAIHYYTRWADVAVDKLLELRQTPLGPTQFGGHVPEDTVYCLFLEEKKVIIDSASPVLLATAFDVAEGVAFSAALALYAIGLSTTNAAAVATDVAG